MFDLKWAGLQLEEGRDLVLAHLASLLLLNPKYSPCGP